MEPGVSCNPQPNILHRDDDAMTTIQLTTTRQTGYVKTACMRAEQPSAEESKGGESESINCILKAVLSLMPDDQIGSEHTNGKQYLFHLLSGSFAIG